MQRFNSGKKALLAQFTLGTAALLSAGVALAGPSAASVSEPGPMGLLILGAAALLIARRYKRNK